MNIHHVGIYIGKINGVDYMVDNGTYGVTIRPVSSITPHPTYGSYNCVAFINP